MYACCKQSVCWFLQCLMVEFWSSCGDYVAVGLRLGHFDGLLLLQDQETVKLGSRLLPVVVPAQVKQTNRVCTSLSHDALWRQKHEIWINKHKYNNVHVNADCCPCFIKKKFQKTVSDLNLCRNYVVSDD